MKENQNWKKLLWPLSVVGMLGVVYLTESAGITTIRDRNYGMVLDYTLEGRRGLPSKEERIYGVSQIWKKASDHFAGWELADREVTWDEAYETACEEAANARNSMEYFRALERFLAHLNSGNSENIGGPNLSAGFGFLPFQLSFCSQEFVVTETMDPDIYPIGTVVETINGLETGMYLEETLGNTSGHRTPGAREFTLAQNLRYGNVGEKLKLEIRRPGEAELVCVTAKWEKRNGFAPDQSEQLELYTEGEVIYHSAAFDVIQMDGNIACFRMKSEMDMACLDSYFEEVAPMLAQYDGVILDWRYNEAGNSLIGHTIIESFFGEEIPYCESAPATMKISNYVNEYGAWNYWRTALENGTAPMYESLFEQLDEEMNDEISAMIEFGEEMHYGWFVAGEEIEALVEDRWNEQYPNVQFVGEINPYKAQVENCQLKGMPVVMIVNKLQGGSSDSTAAEAKAAGMTLVGTGTMGATGTLMMIDLGAGWMTAISTQRALTPEGTDITNNGVEAQVQVDLTAEDIANGHDSQMEKAVEVVKEMIAERQ